MAITTPTTTRRGALGAIAGASTIALAAPSLAAPTEFHRAVAAMLAAEAQSANFERNVYEPACAAAAKAQSAVPHETVSFPSLLGIENGRFAPVRMSTADAERVEWMRRGLAGDRSGHRLFGSFCESADFRSSARELVDAADRREAALAEIRRRHRIDALMKESDRLSNNAYRAFERMATTPAPDAAALALKMELVFERVDVVDEWYHAALLADAKVLA